MKKIDNRGFVMVETIIVAVFIIGICTFLFANFLPLIADYERISDYDTVEAKYKAHEIRKMILRDLSNNNDLEELFISIPSDVGYSRYSNYTTEVSGEAVIKNSLCDNLSSVNYCNKLLSSSFLGVKDIFITSFKLGKIKSTIKNIAGERALKEYIDYLPSYSKYASRYDSYYRLIIVFNGGEMANIEVHYEIG